MKKSGTGEEEKNQTERREKGYRRGVHYRTRGACEGWEEVRADKDKDRSKWVTSDRKRITEGDDRHLKPWFTAYRFASRREGDLSD